ncbi:MAG: cache domain-containing protein [Candidatus Aminicenantes bacterium]|nr:cache domain-containing protein [Candidatus Aminicenantes bacterium]
MIKKLLRSSIRFKLVISLLSIVFLAGTLSIFIGLNVINTNIIREAYDAVRTSLAATNELYQEEIENRSRIIQYLAKTPEIVRATTGKDRAFLFEKLVQIQQEFEFDIVNVVNADGTLLVRANNFEAFGDSMTGYRTIQDVQKTHAPTAGTGVLDFENIAREGRELADRTLIKIIPTSQLRPPPSPVEDRAMIIKIAAPILSGEKLEGVLYAAILLNNNAGFIDRFKRLVFKEEKINGRDVGTTTIFLGGIRVATNVVDSAGRRAIGTQVSDEVYERVFVEGQDWLGEAMVVNHWYISGYSPIYDFDRRILGMLYNGVLKEKFDLIVRKTTISFLLVILLTTILALAISAYLITLYTKPVKRIIDASTVMALGFFNRIEVDPHDDEDARNLSRAFNEMVDAIEERDRQLKEQAERTILKSEKLASIGRLASGIAHEINNPLTGVLTFSSLLLKDLKGTKHEEDLRVIQEETLRCRTIVGGVLNFAREDKPEKAIADVNAIIEESLKILEKHVNFHDIEIIKKLDPAVPPIRVDASEIRSVVNNLAVNAADAMPGGGRLTIATGTEAGSGAVIITVTDTGIGISKENIGKIFDPFFTTKDQSKGTGLGLAMVYGVIARHNGMIDVRSEVGEGAEFTIRLPLR